MTKPLKETCQVWLSYVVAFRYAKVALRAASAIVSVYIQRDYGLCRLGR